jgi:hypothetical protein
LLRLGRLLFCLDIFFCAGFFWLLVSFARSV